MSPASLFWTVAGLCCLLGSRLGALAQYGYNYDLNYYDDYSLYTAGYHYDTYDEEDEGFYFNPYTGSYDDVYGDYFFDDVEEEEVSTCRLAEDGKPKFEGNKPCDLKVDGADKHLKGLNGGLDGKYEVHSCENGRPLYKREDSPKNEERLLWYSSEYRDWDLTNGTMPRDDDILVFGGNGGREPRPEYVQGSWSIATEFLKDSNSLDEYSQTDMTVACADGSKVTPGATNNFGKTPLLTHEEMDAQYNAIYSKARNDSGAEVNLGLVTLFVMIGLGVVFGLPYMMARNRRNRKDRAAGGGALSSILELSRKRGHIN